ncbi:hypothetical protein AMS68_001819 [Peltaster fructicola]|uniref:AMP-dependent synthetase/ligase domain-containing protein n=1 Tax=Peltaster fructicola TaxID=286661 RepID=A0A6H0XNG7_9PEZI|nr:hypothetical protein AMS68_001819 [Peltaster fructicola]
MPWKSRWTVDIPTCSLPTYLFQSPTATLSDKPVLLDAAEPRYHLTQATYRLWAQRLAAGLLAKGFQPGDRLLLFSGNTIFFPVVLMGTIMAGGIFSGANPGYVARELEFQLSNTGATFLICWEDGLDIGLEAAQKAGLSKDHVFVFDGGMETFDERGRAKQGIQHWSKLLADVETGRKFAWKEAKTRADMDETIVLNYSSGTTGVPKGVEITHMNYVSNCMQTEYVQALDPDYEQRLTRWVGLSMLPMYHAYGQTVFCVSSVQKRIPVYIMRKFDFGKMLDAIQKYRITGLTLVPPIAVALAKRPEVKNFDLSSIEAAGCGAAPLGQEAKVEFEGLWSGKQVNLKQGWGMTEITCSACGIEPTMWADDATVGELNPNIEGMIIDDDGKELGINERGEFLVKGPNVMKGYWRREDATRDTMTADGWLKTGDIAYRDEKGMIYIVDRKKELIKVKGNQVAPAELEGLLLEHPSIQDAAVIGVTINGEELPRAYIHLQDGTRPTEQEIASWLGEKVAKHKRLAGGVKFVDLIPKNPSGKILRKILREQAAKEVGDQGPRASKL